MEITNSRLHEMRLKRTLHSNRIPKKQNPEVFRITALVVSSSGEVVGWGYNHLDPNSTMTIHAEHDAISKATRNLLAKGARLRRRLVADLYVMRDNGMNSKPCYNCITECIYNNPYFNFRHIHYTHEDSPTGFVTLSSNQLYDTRWSYISSANVRRMTQNGTLIESPEETDRPTAQRSEYCRKCANGDCNRHHQRTVRSSPKSQQANSQAKAINEHDIFQNLSLEVPHSTVIIYSKISSPLGRFT